MTRNRFEQRFADAHPDLEYEAIKLPYITEHTYCPDFIDRDAKTIWETKGRLTQEDRSKMLAVKKAHPDWRIIFVFQYPHRTLSKASKTTYAKWAEKNGFEWEQLSEKKK